MSRFKQEDAAKLLLIEGFQAHLYAAIILCTEELR